MDLVYIGRWYDLFVSVTEAVSFPLHTVASRGRSKNRPRDAYGDKRRSEGELDLRIDPLHLYPDKLESSDCAYDSSITARVSGFSATNDFANPSVAIFAERNLRRKLMHAYLRAAASKDDCAFGLPQLIRVRLSGRMVDSTTKLP